LESIELLYKEINHLKIEHEKDLDQLNSSISELRSECDELKQSLLSYKKSQEVLNEKLNESHKRNMLLINENEQLTEFRKKNEYLFVEKEQMSIDLEVKQAELVQKHKQISELNERLAEERNKVDEQEKELEHLKAECDKMRKEKHVQCQMRIHELTIESMNQKERLTLLEEENSKNIKLVDNLNKQIERLKIEMQSFNFKEFVSLKRELNSLKLEKERHFADQVTTPPNANQTPASNPPLPPIKQQAKKNLFNFFHE
jgi:chromosome segregation ATPase